MIVSLLYECIYWFLFLLYMPRLLYQMIVHKKYRKSFLARCGFQFVHKRGSGPLFWFHAVSVGETSAIAKLALKIKEANKNASVIITSITETGHATAKKVMPFADDHLFLPFDSFFIMRRFVSKIVPDVVILSEGDFWYRFFREVKKKGAVIILANGKISEKSKTLFKSVSFLAKKLFSMIDLFLVQSEHYKMRFLQLSVPGSKIKVTGNTKGDMQVIPMTADEKGSFAASLGIRPSDFVIVAGSTHDPEETMIVEGLLPLLKEHPSVKLLIVPRHPERFDTVAGMLKGISLSSRRMSSGAIEPIVQLLLIDAMGLLTKCYQLAHVAICAGSFVSHVGGHNILEPSFFDVPVICGPHMHSQPELIAQALAWKSCLQIKIGELHDTVKYLVDHKTEREAIGRRGGELIKSLQGAIERSFYEIESIVPEIMKD